MTEKFPGFSRFSPGQIKFPAFSRFSRIFPEVAILFFLVHLVLKSCFSAFLLFDTNVKNELVLADDTIFIQIVVLFNGTAAWNVRIPGIVMAFSNLSLSAARSSAHSIFETKTSFMLK